MSTPTTIPVKASDLTKLAKDDESITVRNNQPTIVVFVPPGDNADSVTWAKRDDASGEDIQELPSVFLRHAQFRKQLNRGILEIIEADDPAVLDAITAQKSAWEAKQAVSEQTDYMIAQQQPKAYSGTQCLAPEGKGRCSEFAITSQNTREKPPLCAKHVSLANQFIPEESGEFQDGKPIIKWNRVTTY